VQLVLRAACTSRGGEGSVLPKVARSLYCGKEHRASLCFARNLTRSLRSATKCARRRGGRRGPEAYDTPHRTACDLSFVLKRSAEKEGRERERERRGERERERVGVGERERAGQRIEEEKYRRTRRTSARATAGKSARRHRKSMGIGGTEREIRCAVKGGDPPAAGGNCQWRSLAESARAHHPKAGPARREGCARGGARRRARRRRRALLAEQPCAPARHHRSRAQAPESSCAKQCRIDAQEFCCMGANGLWALARVRALLHTLHLSLRAPLFS
jgi:hypothetical protein